MASDTPIGSSPQAAQPPTPPSHDRHPEEPRDKARPRLTFGQFAKNLSDWCGSPRTFQLALVAILAWALSGPYFHFNDTWQLIINTSTTIITFLMVFLIQNTQNRDNDALHIKLDELLRVTKGAQDRLLNLENLDAHQLKALREQYAKIGELAAKECGKDELIPTPARHVETVAPAIPEHRKGRKPS